MDIKSNNIFPNSVIDYICYHGTDAKEIKELDKTKIQKDYKDGADSGYLGWGFYLTKNKEYASEYGDNVLEFNVNIEHPFILEETKLDTQKFIDYLFSNSGDRLYDNLQNSLDILRLFSKGKGGDFENKNSEELMLKCKNAYINYSDIDLDDKDIEELKELFCELSLEPNNWLNGLFFYFGKELFHYFIAHGFDGVIALDGIEIVVYESNQLKQINTIERLLN